MCPRCASRVSLTLCNLSCSTKNNLGSNAGKKFLLNGGGSNCNTQQKTGNHFSTLSRPALGIGSGVASFFGFTSADEGVKQQGRAFLTENKDKQGVITLKSGLQYKVLKEGGGKLHPLAHTPCDCHYEGRLLDGKKFDSSYDRGQPTTFAPNQVIPGWTEAMQLMKEGDLWELYIPSELAYGDAGVGNGLIPGGACLVFKMEIVKVKGPGKLVV